MFVMDSIQGAKKNMIRPLEFPLAALRELPSPHAGYFLVVPFSLQGTDTTTI